jgi:hypothetical protein
MADETPAAPAAKVAGRVRPVADWAARKGTPAIWLRAACAGQRWTDPSSVVIDEQTFDAAITAAQTVRCG